MGTKYGAYMGRVLKVDLSSQETGEYPWTDEDREKYLGGKIMAGKIISDNVDPKTDPFSEDNWLVVSTGPLTGVPAPSSSRFNISTLSPLTGILTSSNCGGSFGMHLKRAGYDALVITGKAEKPTYIEINEDDIGFHDAGGLWGMTTSKTQETLGGKTGKLVIGPAGENRVKFAGVFSQQRTAGRTGVGAVFGSKNLKAVTATGSKKATPLNPEKSRKVYKRWVKLLESNPFTNEYLPKYGSSFLLKRMHEQRLLATRNFSDGQFEDYDKISGETLAEKHLIKNWGCPTCTIKCSRQVEINGQRVKGPELETLSLLGANLGIDDLETIILWNYQLDELGMDTISAGNIIGFAMELQKAGLWDTGLEFGKTENIAQLFDDIAHRRGIGDKLAEGTRALAEEFGGKDFAIHVKGLELAAYEPRGAVGQGLGYATANRGGCHLNAGYPVFTEGLGLKGDPYTTMGKAANTILNQNLLEAVSASGCCTFPLFSFYPGILLKDRDSLLSRVFSFTMPFSGGAISMLNKAPAWMVPIHLPSLPHTKALAAATGMKMNAGVFKEIGERGYTLERLYNMKAGITAEDDTLPKRLTDVPQVEGDERTKVPLAKLKKQYYKLRGWDANGAPTEAKKKKLGLT